MDIDITHNDIAIEIVPDTELQIKIEKVIVTTPIPPKIDYDDLPDLTNFWLTYGD